MTAHECIHGLAATSPQRLGFCLMWVGCACSLTVHLLDGKVSSNEYFPRPPPPPQMIPASDADEDASEPEDDHAADAAIQAQV